MRLMRRGRFFDALSAALFAVWASAAQAAVLYEQDFNPPNTPTGYTGEIADAGWLIHGSVPITDPDGPYAFTGTYAGSFAPVLLDAATNQPINGNTGVFLGNGGPANFEGMMYVEDGSGGFTSFDPATCDRCLLTVYSNTQGGGLDDHGFFSVLTVNPEDSRDATWHVQTTPMAQPTSSGTFFDFRSLLYDASTSGGWQDLDVFGATLVRGAASPDLTGRLIGGVGVVHAISNVDGNDFSTLNYSDYRILCVPEPASAALLACAVGFLLCSRRKVN